MTDRPTKNVAASVHQRLKNEAVASRQVFSDLLQHYALQRILYRLGILLSRRSLPARYDFADRRIPSHPIAVPTPSGRSKAGEANSAEVGGETGRRPISEER